MPPAVAGAVRPWGRAADSQSGRSRLGMAGRSENGIGDVPAPGRAGGWPVDHADPDRARGPGRYIVDAAMTGFAHPELLATTDWLAERLDDPSIRIVDCDEFPAYQRLPIPGAGGLGGPPYPKGP